MMNPHSNPIVYSILSRLSTPGGPSVVVDNTVDCSAAAWPIQCIMWFASALGSSNVEL